jgi:hypothetical protein
MDFEEMGYEGLDWIQLTPGMILWEALVGKVLNIQVSYRAEYFFASQQLTYSQEEGVNAVCLGLTIKLLCAIINSLYRSHI